MTRQVIEALPMAVALLSAFLFFSMPPDGTAFWVRAVVAVVAVAIALERSRPMG